MSGSQSDWIVGADPTCQIVIDQPTVSGRHCRIGEKNGQWTVEDLGSTNGTFVNGQRITKLTRVTGADQITLGKSIPLALPKHRVEPSPAVNRRWVVGAGAVVVTILFVVTAVWAFRGIGSRRESIPATVSGDAATQPLAPSVSGPDSTDTTTVVAGGSSNPSDASEEPEKKKIDTAVRGPANDNAGRALFVVAVSDTQGKEIYAIGTAVAVDQGTLLTSASVLAAAEKLKGRYPDIRVLDPAAREFHAVKQFRIHRQYSETRQELQKLQKRHDELSVTLESQGDATIEKEIAELETTAQGLMSTLVAHDAAVLELEAITEVFLSLASDASETAGDLRLSGLPRPEDDLFLSMTALKQMVRTHPCRAVKGDATFAASAPWSLEASSIDSGLNWLGSPVLNAQGEIVAIYARRVESEEEVNKGERFEASPIASFRELLSER